MAAIVVKASPVAPLTLQLKSKYASNSYSFIPTRASDINFSIPLFVISIAFFILSTSSCDFFNLNSPILL